MGLGRGPASSPACRRPARMGRTTRRTGSSGIGDLPLESGETIRDFAISYVTHGTLNADKSNAILMATAIGGNHHRIDFLIGPGKALDTDKYFIVATDAIGNGLTTSPSNSVSQHGTAFPHFTIRDMVESQKRLLDRLGITHLVAVAGASMGGMQALQWGVSHPGLMDALVAITPDGAHGALVDRRQRGHPQGADARSRLQGRRLRPAARAGLAPARRHPAGAGHPHAGGAARASPRSRSTSCPGCARRRRRCSRPASTPMTGSPRPGPTTATTSARPPDSAAIIRKALAAIKARTLIITGGNLDLYNPVEEAREAGAFIPQASVIAVPSVQGHTAGQRRQAGRRRLHERGRAPVPRQRPAGRGH